MYFDVPATPGCETNPNIIMQTHMDMVTTTDDSLGDVDPQKLSVDIVKDEDTGMVHARDYLTNCGADDGAGIGFCLALAKNKNVSHGPIRMLFTTYEENGCQGSKYVPESFLNADYLLNIDGNRIGEVDISSAGFMSPDYYKTMSTSQANAGSKMLTISIADLEGGHSGMDITKPRKSAVSLITDMLDEISQTCPTYQIASIDCGKAYNAIAAHGKFVICVDANKADEVANKIKSFEDTVKKDYADEKNVKIEVAVSDPSIDCISNADSELIHSVLKEIPNGVIKMSEIKEGMPETSANIGFFSLSNGRLRIGFSARSNSTETFNNLSATFTQIRDKYALEYHPNEDAVLPAWPTSGDNALSKLYLKGLADQCGLEGYEAILHGGVEPARFVAIHPGMLAICIGFDIQDEHGLTEAWYTKSAPVCVAAILNLVDNITSLK